MKYGIFFFQLKLEFWIFVSESTIATFSWTEMVREKKFCGTVQFADNQLGYTGFLRDVYFGFFV